MSEDDNQTPAAHVDISSSIQRAVETFSHAVRMQPEIEKERTRRMQLQQEPERRRDWMTFALAAGGFSVAAALGFAAYLKGDAAIATHLLAVGGGYVAGRGRLFAR